MNAFVVYLYTIVLTKVYQNKRCKHFSLNFSDKCQNNKSNIKCAYKDYF